MSKIDSKKMNDHQKISDFCEVLHDALREPGWFMMKPTNASHPKMKRIVDLFVDHREDIRDIAEQYCASKGAIVVDVDLHMKEIIASSGWRDAVTNHIEVCGEFAGDLALLHGSAQDQLKLPEDHGRRP